VARPDVVVVGGGVIGAACAFFAAREGLAVTLLERDEIGAHASGVAAGMLALLLDDRHPEPFQRWGRRSLESLPELIVELRERSGIDPEYEPSGLLRVALSDQEAAGLREKAGGELSWLDAAEAREQEPQLAPEARGALWSAVEGHVRSGLLTRAYARAAAALGARIETGCSVVGLLRQGARVTGVRTVADGLGAGAVVLCMGSWSAGAAAWLGGPALPVEPVRGQILSLDAPRPTLRQTVSNAHLYLVPRRDGSVVAGATVERVGFDCRVTAAGVREMLELAPRLVPALADCAFRGAWAGLRPDTPDHLPLIGPVPGAPGLYVAAGHFRNGILLSPVTGRLVADWLLGKAPPDEAAAFRPDRFAG
jgi:glycine oxidase